MAEVSKRNALTDIERQRLRVYRDEHISLTQQDLVLWFKNEFGKSIVQSQIHEILSDKYKRLDVAPATDAKRNRKRPFEALEIALYEWSKTVDHSHKLSNKDLKAKAAVLWEEMASLPQWKDVKPPNFSDGWLSKWRKYAEHRKVKENDEHNSAGTYTGVHDIQFESFACNPYESTILCPIPVVSSSQSPLPNIIATKRRPDRYLDFDNFASSVSQTDPYISHFTELNGERNSQTSLLLRSRELSKKRKGIPQHPVEEIVTSNLITASVATSNRVPSPRALFDFQTNIEYLSCQSVFNQLFNRSTVFTKREIMRIFADIFSVINQELEGFQLLRRQFFFSRETLPQAKLAIDLLTRSEIFNVLPPNIQEKSFQPLRSSKVRPKGGSLALKCGRVDIICSTPYSSRPRKFSAEAEASELVNTKIMITPPSKGRTIPQVIFNISSQNGISTPILPTISFRRLIPKNSDIFRIARYGTLLEFRKALDQGIGSLDDYDGEKSLFLYAIDGWNLEILDFLIPLVDLNSYEIQDGYSQTIFANFEFKYEEILTQREKATFQVQKYNNLRKKMLHKGADPTLPEYLDVKWPILDVDLLSRWGAEFSQFFLETEAILINDGLAISGMTPATYFLFELCRTVCSYARRHENYTGLVSVLRWLLSYGADVYGKDEDGYTCLHHVFYYIEKQSADTSLLYEFFLIMLAAGADPFAVDSEGESVSERASRYGWGDLWEEALAESGHMKSRVHDISEAEASFSLLGEEFQELDELL